MSKICLKKEIQDKKMASGEKKNRKYRSAEQGLPFASAEEAWFWFVQAQEARNDGARFTSGIGVMPRPCEPLDILKVVDGLYRNRRLLRDHLLVLRHYGRRKMAPDPNRVKEVRADAIWLEALERIEKVLERKGIVQRKRCIPNEDWQQSAIVLEGVAAE